jgi:rhamnose utilization protein RhaD (predicted bifunctional aldolase and dehydrogenase)
MMTQYWIARRDGPMTAFPMCNQGDMAVVSQSTNRLNELIALSVEIGDPAKDYVILAEGNTSARISEHSFWVKGSGVRLEAARGPQDFVAMELEPLMRTLRGEDEIADMDLRELLRSARVEGQDNSPDPSIEAFVHAICLELGKAEFVAHTHPTAVNALLCARNAELVYSGVLFPDEAVICGPVPLFIPYGEPGLPLGRMLLRRFESFLDTYGEPPRLILLANHGIVALGSTAAEVATITAMAVKAARIRHGTLSAGGPNFLSSDQAARLFGRQDERERRQRLMQTPDRLTPG